MTADPNGLTRAGFQSALAERGIAPAPADRDAAFRIATFLDGCARRLQDAEKAMRATGPDGDA